MEAPSIQFELAHIIQVLDIGPADLIVLTCQERLTEEAYQRLVKSFEASLNGPKVVILEGGIELKAVLKKEGENG